MHLHTYRDENRSRHLDLIGQHWSVDLVTVTAASILVLGFACAVEPCGWSARRMYWAAPIYQRAPARRQRGSAQSPSASAFTGARARGWRSGRGAAEKIEGRWVRVVAS